jgi:hypothetical protein
MKGLCARKALFAAVLAAVLSSCGPVKIRKIVANPGHYHNREVRVSGVVTRSHSVPIAGYYQVDDGTGTIHVLSNGPAPPQGVDVTVKGTVTSGVTVMGRGFGTALREREHRVR